MSKTPEQMAEEYRDLLLQNGERVNVFDAFLAGYQAAKPQWISVNERLPEDKKMVIYWHENFGANVGHYDSTYHKEHYHWFSNNWGDHGDFRVHWWMPLPEPPKGAE